MGSITGTYLHQRRFTNSPPFYYNGRVFHVGSNGTTAVSVWSATFDDSSGDGTWAEDDSANRFTSTTITDIQGYYCVQDGTNIHMVVDGLDGSGNSNVQYGLFSMSSRTWTTTDQDVATSLVRTAGHGYSAIAIRSDGDKVVFYQDSSAVEHGTDVGRVSYTIHQGTAWGDASGAVDDGGATDYDFFNCRIDDNDLIHIIYTSAGDAVHKSLNSSNTLSSVETVDTGVDTDIPPQPGFYNDGSNRNIYVVTISSDTAYETPIVNDGTPGSNTQISTTTIYSGNTLYQKAISLTVDPSTGDRFVMWSNNADKDHYRKENVGSGWASETEVQDAITLNTMEVGVFTTDESAVILGYTYDESGTNYFGYEVLATGGATITVTSTIASGESVFSPQINLHITDAGNIASGEQVYAPDSVGTQTISGAGGIASGEAVYSPQLDLQIDAGTVASGEQVYSPTLTIYVTDAGNIASGEAVYQPQIDLHITDAGNVASGEVVYSPQLDLHIDAGTVTTSEQVYSPTVSIEGGDQSITQDSTIASGEVVYNPQIDLHITDAGNIASGESVYSPQIDLHIDAGTVTTSEQVYAPVVTLDSGDQTITVTSAIASGEVVYSPTLIQEQFITVTAVIASGETVYSPQIDLVIAAGTITTGESVYSPQVNLHIDAGTVASGEVVYAPVITGAGLAQTITIDAVIASGEVVYALTVERGPALGHGNLEYENGLVSFERHDATVQRQGEQIISRGRHRGEISFDSKSERLTTFGRVKRG